MAKAISRYTLKRHKMVDEQLVPRGISDKRVLQVFSDIPRHLFVPETFRDRAYEDRPLPIGESQTISQPYMVALMTEKLDIKADSQILEIGTGSGYQTAILASLADKVYSIERHMSLVVTARQVLSDLRTHNVLIKVSDGTLGWDEYSPYDRILIAAGAPEIPKGLLRQLKIGGKMILPVGDSSLQRLLLLTRTDEINYKEEGICGCTFVPLIGKYGWDKSDIIP